MTPPDLSVLFTAFLRQTHAAPLETEIEPFHPPAALWTLDPRTAWRDGLAAPGWFLTNGDAQPFAAMDMNAVPDWPALVRAQAPALAVPFAVGNYPQMLLDVSPLLKPGSLSLATDAPGRPLADFTLTAANGRQSPADRLVHAALLRLCRRYPEAEQAFDQLRTACPPSWRPLIENEAAATLWHAGKHAEAGQAWGAIPSAAPPVLFNRGLSGLFLGSPETAISPLMEAVRQLPESLGGWHHLAHLYLALARMHAAVA